MKTKQLYRGEWIAPRRKNFIIKCCDCGLVHYLDFRIKKKHIIELRAKLKKGKIVGEYIKKSKS